MTTRLKRAQRALKEALTSSYAANSGPNANADMEYGIASLLTQERELSRSKHAIKVAEIRAEIAALDAERDRLWSPARRGGKGDV